MTDHAHPSDDERIEAELAAALVADEETPLSGGRWQPRRRPWISAASWRRRGRGA